jgi:hypothetical protein
MVNKTSGWKMSIACTAFLMMCSLVLSACSVGSIPKQEENCDTSTTPDVCETAAGSQETTPQVNNEIIDMAMAAYRDVLLGKSNYFDAPTAENLNINQLYDIDSIFPATPTQFVLQDLDDDGLPEVIVQMDMNGIENFGSLILHYEDGQVVGYCLWRRAFGDLKTDNTFYTSGGAFDHGYSRIDFSAFDNTADAPSNTIIHPVCYCSSSAGYDEDGELIEKYYNDGVEITAEEFEREQERQFAKENVQWMEFTSDNIKNSIAQFQNSSNR